MSYLPIESTFGRERTIKVAVIGHSYCGKRSLIHRLIENAYSQSLLPQVCCEFRSKYEIRNHEFIQWSFMILPGKDSFLVKYLSSLQDVEAVILCRDCKADDEDDELFFRQMKQTIQQYTRHASLFAIYTKNDRQSMEYEPYPPNLLEGVYTLGMTSAKLNTGFEHVLDDIYRNLPYMPYRRPMEEESPPCCCQII